MATKTVGKQVTHQSVIGQQGINFVEKIVLRMGCAWHPTNASMDAGIDGEIELVNPATREAANAIIRVQSKATMKDFPRETGNSFEWPCDDRDIEYWMSGNAPVILVVSRPHTEEGYWVHIKSYFADPIRRRSKKVVFDKTSSRFTADSLPELFSIALTREVGIYFDPPPRPERLYSNLLRITGLPESLWQADTDLTHPRQVFEKLRDAGLNAPEFVLRGKRILTIHDLSQAPWSGFVDKGTAEQFDTDQWSQSTDAETLRDFVQLLNFCLKARCSEIGCARRREDDLFYFEPGNDGAPRIVDYRSVKELTQRTVFGPFAYKKGKKAGTDDVAFYRHSGFYGQFKRYDGDWFLEITPSYLFTSDGFRKHPFHESKLKGIKALEKNATVLGQVVMWAALLRGHDDDQFLLSPPPEQTIQFGALESFELSVGLDDKSWLPNEEDEQAKSVAMSSNDLPLFQMDAEPYLPSDGDELED
jgi:hypothetical protein